MRKSDLITALAAAHPHYFHKDVERIVNVILEEIVAALARGERVELRGFGAFSVRERAARMGRNPRTEEDVWVRRKFVPYFKPGKALANRINGSGETAETARARRVG